MRNITPDICHTLGIDNELYNSVQGCGAKMSSHPVKDIIAVVDEQQLH